jgi:hypothetical protein
LTTVPHTADLPIYVTGDRDSGVFSQSYIPDTAAPGQRQLISGPICVVKVLLHTSPAHYAMALREFTYEEVEKVCCGRLLQRRIPLTPFFQHNKEGDLVCPISYVRFPRTRLITSFSGLSLTVRSTISPGLPTCTLVVLLYFSRMVLVCPPPWLPLCTRC